MAVVPVIGAKGTYVLDAPFDTSIDTALAYECVAIRTYGEMQGWGKDPYTEVYARFDIPKEKYEADTATDAVLVTLRADSGQLLVVPSLYILECPVIGGIPYNVIAVAVKLGAIPDTLPLDSLTSKVTDLVLSEIGISPDIAVVKLSGTKLISNTEHEALEQARQNKITSTFTNTGEIARLQQENTTLQEQIILLKQYIEANITTP